MANVYFLGGMDLEMQEIRELLVSTNEQFYDKGLAWGASVDDYSLEILAAISAGNTPVLIELSGKAPKEAIVVDHHGDRAGENASIRQVHDLLREAGHNIEWTRHHQLVATNDVGHIQAMQAMGATREEIAEIRAADRAAQGITSGQEAEGERAVSQAVIFALPDAVTAVVLHHGKTATVMDRLALLETPPQNVVIFSPGETNFYGDGDRIERLDAAFPGGWKGGQLPVRGFWGISQEISLLGFSNAYMGDDA